MGVLRTAADAPTPSRLAELRDDFRSLLDEFQPWAVAVERVTQAIGELDVLTGADSREAVLDAVFARFCIGK